jgi:MSHA pilin protein MshD
MSTRRQAGLSLIEAVIFIVVLGIGFSGMLILYNQITRGSVDPLVRKQALAIAASLLEEIELRGFTYCDPDDSNVYTATSTAGCTSAAYIENMGPETLPGSLVEVRYPGANPLFDNVNDYDGFNMSGANIRSVDGTAISSSLGGYAVLVAVAPIASGELPDVATTSDALRVTVTVTGPAGVSVSLQGYRLRYAPNSP